MPPPITTTSTDWGSFSSLATEGTGPMAFFLDACRQRAKGMRVASVQMGPLTGEKRANVARSIEFIEAAAARGAELVVLPELANTGYVFCDRQEARALAEPVPGGETVL